MIRVRFKTDPNDPRPVKYPPPHPWWCSGFQGEGYSAYCIVVAYADSEEQILEYWPDAEGLDVMNTDLDTYTFTDRFPCPEWFSHLQGQ